MKKQRVLVKVTTQVNINIGINIFLTLSLKIQPHKAVIIKLCCGLMIYKDVICMTIMAQIREVHNNVTAKLSYAIDIKLLFI